MRNTFQRPIKKASLSTLVMRSMSSWVRLASTDGLYHESGVEKGCCLEEKRFGSGISSESLAHRKFIKKNAHLHKSIIESSPLLKFLLQKEANPTRDHYDEMRHFQSLPTTRGCEAQEAHQDFLTYQFQVLQSYNPGVASRRFCNAEGASKTSFGYGGERMFSISSFQN